jgi:hypothetical protein
MDFCVALILDVPFPTSVLANLAEGDFVLPPCETFATNALSTSDKDSAAQAAPAQNVLNAIRLLEIKTIRLIGIE